MPPLNSYQLRCAIRNEFARAGIVPGTSVRTAVRAAADPDAFRWILTTEQPATVFDWDRWDFVSEVLLIDGMNVPSIKQVPLLDSHSRSTVDDVLGSVNDFQQTRAGGFIALDGSVNFAADEKSQRTSQKVLDGHITDGSVGYHVSNAVWIPEGMEAAVKVRMFTGPLKVSYASELREFSITPIGADTLAKVRSLCAGLVGRLA